MEATLTEDRKLPKVEMIVLLNTKTGLEQEVSEYIYRKQYTFINESGGSNRRFRPRFKNWILASDAAPKVKQDISEGLDDQGFIHMLMAKKVLTQKGPWYYFEGEKLASGIKKTAEYIKAEGLTDTLKERLNG